MRLEYAPYRLKFKKLAKTSRETMQEKVTCFLKLYDEKHPESYGIGEAAVFPGLSPEANSSYEYKIMELMANVAIGKATDLSRYSSLQFGLEQAIWDFSSGCRGCYFDSDFLSDKSSIEINGLVWMNDFETMLSEAHEKIEKGFKCIKFKIGAIDWDKELSMLRSIRKLDDSLEIRVDANGGLQHDILWRQLDELAELNVQSIEQPVPKGNIELMARICKESKVPVALDEELIGVYGIEEKRKLVRSIKPAYLVLKPALCGGFSGAEEWIGVGSEEGVGFWVTSALESNVGLDAIAQWTALHNSGMAQGLGTGSLYVNNFETPLYLEADRLHHCTGVEVDRKQFENLDWRAL